MAVFSINFPKDGILPGLFLDEMTQNEYNEIASMPKNGKFGKRGSAPGDNLGSRTAGRGEPGQSGLSACDCRQGNRRAQSPGKEWSKDGKSGKAAEAGAV